MTPSSNLHRAISRRAFAERFGRGFAALAPAMLLSGGQASGGRDTKIAEVELTEYTGHRDVQAGIDNQYQVNPLDVYDDQVRPPYLESAPVTQSRTVKSIYLRLKTAGGLAGLYGPIERDVAMTVNEELRSFLSGKDALAGETLWDQMYRSNRHSRGSLFLMAISAVDNAAWDLRARYYGVPVYRLLGGPSRKSIEAYASCLGFSLNPEAVRKRCLQFQQEGYRYQKWFMAYGPGSGPEGMRKNTELVRILRETLGDDAEIMFDSFSGWDLDYALEWAHQVERYRPFWMEESTHPEKIESFATLRRSTTVPVASGEHFYGRWEVERYLQTGALAVVQADPEWCGGISELLKIGTIASVHDVRVIPHGHSLHAALHVIASQSPMTFPLAEYLVIKMKSYYHFEKHPPVPQHAHFALPEGPGFDIEMDSSKIEKTTVLKWT